MEAGLGRTVFTRDRFARSWGLGDRSSPACFTPALIISPDEQLPTSIAPFFTSRDEGIPTTLSLSSRLPLSPPEFSGNLPNWRVSIGNVLPPSLDEADAGEEAERGQLLPISWQSLNHDATLLNTDLEPAIICLVDALNLAASPGKLVKAISVIKRRFPAALIWAPGIGGPDNIALMSWIGIDLFDLVRSNAANAAGMLLSRNGPREFIDDENSVTQVAEWTSAIYEVRSALNSGNLRRLAYQQSLNSPRLVEHLRYFDGICSEQCDELLTRIVEDVREFRSDHPQVLDDPLVKDWVRHLNERYVCPQGLDQTLVLLPCSAKKPYKMSKSHRAFRRTIGSASVHEVMVTSPLGLVPRDLEEIWPARHYDIPVTGQWSAEEINRINSMTSNLVERIGYSNIINHSGIDLDIDCIDTRKGERATSNSALARLSEAIKDSELPNRRGNQVVMDMMRSVASFHLGDDSWLEDCTIKGRPPRWKVISDGQQLAVWSPERGGFSISATGISSLFEKGLLPRVELVVDDPIKGDLFPHMIGNDIPQFRQGDDVLLTKNNHLIASVRTLAPSWEWNNGAGKLAKLHHKFV